MNFGDIMLYSIIGLIIYYIFKRILISRSVKTYNPDEVKEKIKNRSIILLDVRNSDERKREHIKGSFHIPVYDLKTRFGELGKFRDKEIICYCRSGSRSLAAAYTLKRRGFNAANMKGGMIRWQNS